jgi:micrococcal nuclease
MKKYGARFLLAFAFVAVFFIGGTAELAGQANPGDRETTVYLSRSGAKYHRENCSMLRAVKTPVTLEAALRAGKTACSVCRPPVLNEAALAQTLDAMQREIYRVNAANLKSYRDADISKMLSAEVIRHIDGDTVELRFARPPAGFKANEKIRMIGVDTPETVHPSKPVQFFGREASNFTKQALLGKRVSVAFDWELRDKYGRLLCYIYTAAGECHNADLIKQGYGHAYISYPFHFMDEFAALGREARTEKRGLYGAE